MTYIQELRLMKRTAWMNIQREVHPPVQPNSAQEKKEITTAVYMLAYLGAIDMTLYDLVEDLQNAGLYKHSIKRNVGRVSRAVATANGIANNTLKRVNGGVRVRQYTDMYEYAYNAIQQHILIESPHRAYSIIKSLARLFTDAYNQVGAKTNHHYLAEVVKILPIIEIPNLKEYNVDFIIQNAVQITLSKYN